MVQFTGHQGKAVRVVTLKKSPICTSLVRRLSLFSRWIKQNLNVPVLFGTTQNAVYNQLFGGMIAYVLMKFIHVQGVRKNTPNPYRLQVLQGYSFVVPCQLYGRLV
ncbi:hypothetical protein [Paenibacillus senegalimassiliensis]|uniref:hypothetical protein n=1 Tax=Paenibacillus senegalimassiliensis TaxID=1737426 RepID=UPI0016524466|nr:hypothetical protein [Paenibacillus senegalimassiliensis]